MARQIKLLIAAPAIFYVIALTYFPLFLQAAAQSDVNGSSLMQNETSSSPPSSILQPGIIQQRENNNNTHSIVALAVSTDEFGRPLPYSGQVHNVTIDIRDGTGNVFVNTRIPAGTEWQQAANTAVQVAQRFTGMDLSSKDIIFTISPIEGPAGGYLPAVDGPSAGAAMTALLISELEGKPVNQTVVMTGTIQEDGSIGQVGGVLYKAQAAESYGANIMLVPAGQATVPDVSCQDYTIGARLFHNCKPIQVPISSIVSGTTSNMTIIEVHNIQEALTYLQSQSGLLASGNDTVTSSTLEPRAGEK
ncbi:MAG: hypothetical protein M3247_08190 [Thermoproteota archaeon]|nr:hypothetical protein [Thermoproteota archaeon]